MRRYDTTPAAIYRTLMEGDSIDGATDIENKYEKSYAEMAEEQTPEEYCEVICENAYDQVEDILIEALKEFGQAFRSNFSDDRKRLLDRVETLINSLRNQNQKAFTGPSEF